jgi:hypothetical protein
MCMKEIKDKLSEISAGLNIVTTLTEDIFSIFHNQGKL